MGSLLEDWERYADTQGNTFICISKLPQFIGKIASNIFGVVTAVKEPTKSKGGDGDWSMNITISDPTCPPPSRGFMILLFKQRREECPDVKVGDIIKCSVKCQGYQGRAQGMISKFNQRGKLYLQILLLGDPNLALSDAQIYSNLMKWWKSLSMNDSSKKIVDRLVNAPTAGGRKRPELTFYDIGAEGQERVYFDTYCKVVKNIPDKLDSSTQMLVVTDFTVNKAETSFDYPLCLETGSIDDLPSIIDPEYLVVLTLWDNHAHSFEIPEGSYLYLQNVQSKIDSSGRFEYAIHGDPVYPTKRLVHFRTRLDDDLAPLLNRERKFMEGLSDSQSVVDSRAIPGKIPSFAPEVTISCENATSNNDDVFGDNIENPIFTETLEEVPEKLLETNFEMNDNIADLTNRNDFNFNQPPMVPTASDLSHSPIFASLDIPTRKRKLSHEFDQEPPAKPDKNIKTISEIVNLPWPGKYKVEAQIVDYLPHSLNQFVHAICPDCNIDFLQMAPESKCSCGSLSSPSKYVYMISLLLYDGNSYLPVLMYGDDAERMLDCPPKPAFLHDSMEAIGKSLAKFFEFENDLSSGLKIVANPGTVTCSLVTFTSNDPSQIRVKLVNLQKKV